MDEATGPMAAQTCPDCGDELIMEPLGRGALHLVALTCLTHGAIWLQDACDSE